MEKLKLHLESIEVTSFDPLPGGEGEARGTVEARAATPFPCSAIDACLSRLCTPRC